MICGSDHTASALNAKIGVPRQAPKNLRPSDKLTPNPRSGSGGFDFINRTPRTRSRRSHSRAARLSHQLRNLALAVFMQHWRPRLKRPRQRRQVTPALNPTCRQKPARLRALAMSPGQLVALLVAWLAPAFLAQGNAPKLPVSLSIAPPDSGGAFHWPPRKDGARQLCGGLTRPLARSS